MENNWQKIFNIRDYSIRNKLMLIVLSVTSFSLVIVFVYVIVSDITRFKSDMTNSNLVHAKLIAEYSAVSLTFDMNENAIETLNKLKSIPSIDAGIVYNSQKEIFAEYYKTKQKNTLPVPISENTISQFVDSHLFIFQPVIFDQKNVGTVFLKVTTQELKKRIQRYLVYAFFIFVLILLVSYFLALGLQRIISVPLLRLTEATKKISSKGNYSMRVKKFGNDEIGILVDEYNNMLGQIQIRENSLTQSANELSMALDDLKQTQSILIETEKLAALGHLISGIAHEINSPLGAIRSSVGNISLSVPVLLNEYPVILNALDHKQKRNFHELMEEVLNKRIMLSSKEARERKKNLIDLLEVRNLENIASIADNLIDMGIYDQIERFDPLLSSPNCNKIIQMAFRLTGFQRSAQNIVFAADRASKVVFALKKYAHIDHENEKIKSNIIDGIETVLTLYESVLKRGVVVVKNYSEIPEILCFPDELNQVWTNLIHNAVQALNYNGELKINVLLEGEYVQVLFTDNGCGIPEEIKDKIFDPFFSTKQAGEGTGMGLDIVKRIISKHDGVIEFESIPESTTFKVLLPIIG